MLNARETSSNHFLVWCEYFRASIVHGDYIFAHRRRFVGDYLFVFAVGTVSSWRSGTMSQARVTDFFLQRKKGVGAPVKPAKDRGSVIGTRSVSSKNKDDLLRSSSIHEEFVRVIEEAAGLSDAETTVGGKGHPSCPRTPKRNSAELGGAVASATVDHSTAKKRRQAGGTKDATATVAEKVTKKKARKKLVLPQDSPQVLFMLLQVTFQPRCACM